MAVSSIAGSSITTLAAGIAAVATACSGVDRPAAPTAPAVERTTDRRTAPSVLAIEHATLLAMIPGSAPVADTTILVTGQRISWIGPSMRAVVPPAARRIDARGRWVIPALVDAHVHVENPRAGRLVLQDPAIPEDACDDADRFLPYVARGVLQIGDLGAMSEELGERRAIETGRVLGPHMMLAAMIDGDPPQWPVGFTRVAVTPEAGRQAVRDAIAEGYDMIKVYSALRLDTFTAIVDEARGRGVRVVGHVPQRGTAIAPYLQPGFTMVAHAEEFAMRSGDGSDAEIAGMVAAAARSGTGVIATLTVDQRILEQMLDPRTLHTRPELAYVSPLVRRVWVERNPYLAQRSPARVAQLRRIIAFNERLVRAFVAAGLPVLAGTDTLVPGVVAGVALHDELAALVAAGLTPYQALDAATRAPTVWMGVGGDRGTVEVGKRADLVVLEGDPLADIANTRRISGVIASGSWLPRRELDARLAALARRYASR